MNQRNLLKGFEVELFTSLLNGENFGVANDVIRDFPEFVKEPDQRNLEYITTPKKEYGSLKDSLLNPRRKLRNWLSQRDLTLLPCSTLSLGNSKKFERSDKFNKYHEFIEKTYGTRVVTTSIHINLGIENLSQLFAALRLIRCEACLFLAISASSPFLDGKPTGAHSQRWLQFPLTPKKVPFFIDHAHYVTWVEDQLSRGIMCNERHLWTSVRPNGPSRPYDLNRIELRICDLISNCDLLLAVTALLELRVLSLFKDSNRIDPLYKSKLSITELADLADMNELHAAKSSLDATFNHWVDGTSITCREWIEKLIDEIMPLAVEMNMVDLLNPLFTVLEDGNQAMKWLHAYGEGNSVKSVIQQSIDVMEEEELIVDKSEVILG